MALKKWLFGTAMGEQIEAQNDNLTEIDANLTEIDANITAIDNELTITDITSTIATSQVEGFTIIKAFKQGRRVDVTFLFKPVEGWNSGIATLNFKPLENIPIVIHKNSMSDVNFNISGIFVKAGGINLLSSASFASTIVGQITYITV